VLCSCAKRRLRVFWRLAFVSIVLTPRTQRCLMRLAVVSCLRQAIWVVRAAMASLSALNGNAAEVVQPLVCSWDVARVSSEQSSTACRRFDYQPRWRRLALAQGRHAGSLQCLHPPKNLAVASSSVAHYNALYSGSVINHVTYCASFLYESNYLVTSLDFHVLIFSFLFVLYSFIHLSSPFCGFRWSRRVVGAHVNQ
jgi:hypothetical protein